MSERVSERVSEQMGGWVLTVVEAGLDAKLAARGHELGRDVAFGGEGEVCVCVCLRIFVRCVRVRAMCVRVRGACWRRCWWHVCMRACAFVYGRVRV